MKCADCKYYIKSKVNGNHCGFLGTKPCEVEKIMKRRDALNKKRRKRYE